MFGSPIHAIFMSSSSSSLPRPPLKRAPRRGKSRNTAVSRFYNQVAAQPRASFGLGNSIRVALEIPPATWLTTSTSVPAYAAYYIAVGNCAQASKFTQLFDQYRIEYAEVYLEPVAPQGTTTFDSLATCVDLDDATVPTTYASVAAHPMALVGQGAASRYTAFVPCAAVSAYDGTFGSYANVPSPWIDSNSPNVQHYGFKAAALPTAAQSIPYHISVRLVVSFRNPGL